MSPASIVRISVLFADEAKGSIRRNEPRIHHGLARIGARIGWVDDDFCDANVRLFCAHGVSAG